MDQFWVFIANKELVQKLKVDVDIYQHGLKKLKGQNKELRFSFWWIDKMSWTMQRKRLNFNIVQIQNKW